MARAVVLSLAVLFHLVPVGIRAEMVTQIIDADGDGVDTLGSTPHVAVAPDGTVFTGANNGTSLVDTVFKISPSGEITQILDESGDGTNPLMILTALAADAAGNAYAAGRDSENVFKVTPAGTITQVIDATGDGTNDLGRPLDVAVHDSTGDVFVSSRASSPTEGGVFKITPGGTITRIASLAGDGTNRLFPGAVAVDAAGNVFVTSTISSSFGVFKVTPGGSITRIIDSTGDGTNPLSFPSNLSVDGVGNAYVRGRGSLDPDFLFKITPGGTISQIFDTARFPAGPGGRVLVDISGTIYTTAVDTGGRFGLFEIPPSGAATLMVDEKGDGTNDFHPQGGIGTDGAGVLYVGSHRSIFKVAPQVGHRVSISKFRGTPPEGTAFKISMRAGKDGNGRFAIPGAVPVGPSSLTIKRSGGSVSDSLTAGTWRPLGNPAAPTGFKYSNPAAPIGGPTRSLFLRQTKIKIVLKETGTMPAPDGASGDITTVLSVGGADYCARAVAPHFKDVAGRLIKSKNQAPPLSCASPSGAFLDSPGGALD